MGLLSTISKAIGNLLKNQPDGINEIDLENILVMSSISIEDYQLLDNKRKSEILSEIYFKNLPSLGTKKLNAIERLCIFASQEDYNISPEAIKPLLKLIVERVNISSNELKNESKKYNQTESNNKLTATIVELASATIRSGIEILNTNIDNDHDILIGASHKSAHIKTIFRDIKSSLKLKIRNKKVFLSQSKVDEKVDLIDECFFIEVARQKIEPGDFFLLNRSVLITIIDLGEDYVHLKNEAAEGSRTLNGQIIKIGSNPSNEYYIPNLEDEQLRIYKEYSKWFIRNSVPQNPLMISFHKKHNYALSDSREFEILLNKSIDVNVNGNIIKFAFSDSNLS